MKTKTLNRFLIAGVFTFAVMTQSAFACMAMPILPPDRLYIPDDNSKIFVSYNDDKQQESLIIQPEFSGNAEHFGLLVPLPVQPEILQAPKNLFTDLEDQTNSYTWRMGAVPVVMDTAAAMTGVKPQITIIDTRDVGQYTTTTLKSNDLKALQGWASTNGYVLQNDYKTILEKYVKNNWYFVAIKINMNTWNTTSQVSTHMGNLDPIEFKFYTKTPMLPWSIMAGNMPEMKITLYTLSKNAWYVPGVDIQYAEKIEHMGETVRIDMTQPRTELPWWFVYDANGKTLIRHAISFNPKNIKSDLYLQIGNQNITGIPDITDRTAVQISPKLLDKKTGINPSNATEFSLRGIYNGFLNETKTYRKGSRGNPVLGIQQFLIKQGYLQVEKPTQYFGSKTTEALSRYQKNNGLTQTGILNNETRDFMLKSLQQRGVVYY